MTNLHGLPERKVTDPVDLDEVRVPWWVKAVIGFGVVVLLIALWVELGNRW